MPLETATYIPDLVAANPAHTDGLNQADSHIRLIKGVTKSTFPNFTAAALASSQGQIDAAVNAVVTGNNYIRFQCVPGVAGTAALPSITPFGDTDTGFYSPGANSMAMSVGGVAAWLTASDRSISFFGPIGAPAIISSGAYSGGTGQLVPVGATLLWWDDVLPAEGGYAWANGSAISRAANPVLWARWGTRFGAGDGSTTFNLPDLRDTAPVGKSTMGAAASRGLQTLTNTVLNALFGGANNTISIAQLPSHAHGNTLNDPGHVHALNVSTSGAGTSATQGLNAGSPVSGSVVAAATGITINNANAGSGNPVNNVQPSTTCNYVVRVA